MLPDTISVRPFITFATLLALTLGISKLLIYRSLDARANDALIIDIAGKQRMLSQRMLAYSALLKHENSPLVRKSELIRVAKEWQTAHNDLLNGNSDRHIPLQKFEHRKRLAELTPLINLCIQDVEALLRHDEVNFERFQDNINIYLTKMNAIVGVLARSSNQKIIFNQQIAAIINTALIVTLFSTVIFILLPYYKKNTSLIQALKEQDKKMKNQVYALKEANEGLNQFMYIASHDMKTPLRSIGSFANLIQRRYADALPEEAREYFRFITQNATSMNQVLDDLVAFNQAGGKSKRELVDLDEVLGQTKLKLAAEISDNDVVITADFLGKVKGAKLAYSQILQNLISNAIVYRDSKRVCQVHVSRLYNAEGSVLVIKDNGVGLDNSYLNKVFMPFQRVGDLDRPGSGIGLAICRKMARKEGGDITFRGEVGIGTSFYLGLGCVPVIEEGMAHALV